MNKKCATVKYVHTHCDGVWNDRTSFIYTFVWLWFQHKIEMHLKLIRFVWISLLNWWCSNQNLHFTCHRLRLHTAVLVANCLTPLENIWQFGSTNKMILIEILIKFHPHLFFDWFRWDSTYIRSVLISCSYTDSAACYSLNFRHWYRFLPNIRS